MYYKPLLIAFTALLAFAFSLHAQDFERSQTFSRSFALHDNTEVNINNKYGNVHIHIWEKDSVRFEVEVTVRSSRQARVDRAFDDIDVRFTSSPAYVIANTVFARSGSILSELSDLGRTVFNTGGSTQINYTVWMPAKARLKVDNRFGNIFTTDHSGDVDFMLSNGSLQAGELSGKSKLIVEFGNANIRHASDTRIELNYSELDLSYASRLNLQARSSNINIREVGHLQLHSRRDRIRVDEAGSVVGEVSFSRTNINRLKHNITLNGNYGSLQLSDIGSGIEYMQLNASYTSLQLYLHAASSATVEINYNKKTRLNLPGEMELIENTELEAGGEAGIVRGQFGDGRQSTIRLSLTGGELSIFSRP